MATIDERIEKLEEKKEQLNQQVKQLKARKSQEERKARTKRLIEIGAAVESVLNRPIEHDELPKLIDFLKTQEQRGHFFSKAMNKDSQNYNSNNDDLDFYSSKIIDFIMLLYNARVIFLFSSKMSKPIKFFIIFTFKKFLI